MSVQKLAFQPTTTISETRQWFADGNLTRCAAASEDCIETYASKALIGITQPAIGYLSARREPKAQFYLACAYWIDGDEDTAIRILTRLQLPAAQRLSTLIKKQRIEVLCQLPWSRTGAQTVLRGIAQDPKFRITNYTFHPDDHPNEPYADVFKWFDPANPPDFYVVNMLEWHSVAKNI